MDGPDDVAAFTEFPQARFELIGETPNAGLDLPRQPEALQHLQSPDAQRAIKVGAELATAAPLRAGRRRRH